MEIQTLEDVLAWVTHLQSLGLKYGPYDAQELGQALQIMAQADAETRQALAAWKADQARLDAALATGDELEVFQAGYEKGYALGWRHAQEAGAALLRFDIETESGPREAIVLPLEFLTGR